MNAKCIKCVAIGDGFVGKTSLLMRLCDQEFDENYSPTIFDNKSISFTHNGQSYDLSFFDTAGQEEYDMLRKQLYDSVNVFIICFDVCNTDSFLNIKETWLSEIDEYAMASKILVGTKSDLREDLETIDRLNADGRIFVNQSGAQNFAEKHKMKYVECSAKTKTNIQELMKTIIEVHNKRISQFALFSPAYCCYADPVLRLVKRILCCKNTY